jgi:hypothetical protein
VNQNRIKHLGGIAKSCPECTSKRRNPRITPICNYCNSTGLVSLLDYERWFSQKLDRPINLNDVRIPEFIKKNHQSPDYESNLDCPF